MNKEHICLECFDSGVKWTPVREDINDVAWVIVLEEHPCPYCVELPATAEIVTYDELPL